MKVEVYQWKLSKLIQLKNQIDPQPAYQRGEVWSERKKALLIDSMLRGYDIPKIYLRKRGVSNVSFEVADGQQRITSILNFLENKLSLGNGKEKGLNLESIGSYIVKNKKFEELNKALRDKFLNYELTVAIVSEVTGDQIRILFGRLQEGVNLNPAEKRNAIISNVGKEIDNFARNHSFFSNSRISEARYKRQDYMTHVIALIKYKDKDSLKASLLEELYLDSEIILDFSEIEKYELILSKMKSIDEESNYKIYKKFHFIDFFWLLYKNLNTIGNINAKKVAKEFDDFEYLRLNIDDPKDLLLTGREEDKNLYDYYNCFRYNGSHPDSIATRNRVFTKLFI